MPASSCHTILAPVHQSLGARMVEFGGWWMPVQYTSILEEHQAVREAMGLFDISHMGQITVRGEKAAAWLDQLLTNRASALAVGGGQYSLMLNEAGGVLDDLLVYRRADQEFFLVVNAARRDDDLQWMRSHLPETLSLFIHDDGAAMALQGPLAIPWLDEICHRTSLPSRNQIRSMKILDLPCWVARTGYTGEDGVEIFCDPSHAPALFQEVLRLGHDRGLKPCGLGARDILRLEACLPLYGQDLSPDITPLEAGLHRFIAWDKPTSFIGQNALLALREKGVPRGSMALMMLERTAPPRPHYPVWMDGEVIGEVTSGGYSPTFGQGIGMALLRHPLPPPGSTVFIEIRGTKFPARLHPKPLYKRT